MVSGEVQPLAADNWVQDKKHWSAGLQPAFSGAIGEKPSATRRSDFSTLASNFYVLHPWQLFRWGESSVGETPTDAGGTPALPRNLNRYRC
jgi:hypothetical protein